jgi:hypothetical protein
MMVVTSELPPPQAQMVGKGELVPWAEIRGIFTNHPARHLSQVSITFTSASYVRKAKLDTIPENASLTYELDSGPLAQIVPSLGSFAPKVHWGKKEVD